MKKHQQKSNIPSVTIFLLSYNDELVLPDCLKSITCQDYKGNIQILLADGGSTDNTLRIAQEYGATIISKPDLRDSPQERTRIGISSVTSDIIVLFSADNRFQENNCLSRMINPFSDKNIAAVETWRYGYFENSSLLTKYFALIGGADPIAVSLGKADRAPYDTQTWHSFGKVAEYPNYFKVTFNSNASEIPTLGANGIAIRKSILEKIDADYALHMDMCLAIIRLNKQFAFVKNVHIVHEISGTIWEFCRRRLRWATLYSSKNMQKRYHVFDFKQDFFRLSKIIIISCTVIIPLLRAVKGFQHYKHRAWFLHPFILLVFVVAYGLQVISSMIKKVI